MLLEKKGCLTRLFKSASFFKVFARLSAFFEIWNLKLLNNFKSPWLLDSGFRWQEMFIWYFLLFPIEKEPCWIGEGWLKPCYFGTPVFCTFNHSYSGLFAHTCKVQLFWEGHKNMRNRPYGFEIYFKINVKTIRTIAQIFVTFSEKLNFNTQKVSLSLDLNILISNLTSKLTLTFS